MAEPVRQAVTIAPAPRNGPATSPAPTVPPIPAILLEGDQPFGTSAEQSQVNEATTKSAAKTGVGPGEDLPSGRVVPTEKARRPTAGPVAPDGKSPVTFPEACGTLQVFLTACDPHCLLVSMDFTREQWLDWKQSFRGGTMMLRILQEPEPQSPPLESILTDDTRQFFVPVEKSGIRYRAELGCLLLAGRWFALATSDWVATPVDPRELEADESEAPVAFAEVILPPPEPATPATAEAPVLVHPVAPQTPAGTVPETTCDAADQALPLAIPLEPPIAPESSCPPEVPPSSSLAIEVPKPPEPSGSAVSLATEDGSFPAPKVGERPEAGVVAGDSIGPWSSYLEAPGAGQPAGRRAFWFNINAELVVYGATEPDAKVILANRPIALRSDGTFTCRFALPEGDHLIAAAAVAADGHETRCAELQVTRATSYRVCTKDHAREP